MKQAGAQVVLRAGTGSLRLKNQVHHNPNLKLLNSNSTGVYRNVWVPLKTARVGFQDVVAYNIKHSKTEGGIPGTHPAKWPLEPQSINK